MPLVGALALALVVVDGLSGPLVRVSILAVLPVALAAWCWPGPAWVALACLFAGSRLWLVAGSAFPWLIGPELVNAGLMLLLYLLTAILVREGRRRAHNAWGPPVPVCGGCGRVEAEGQWVRFERFVVARTGGAFHHTVCPECERLVLPATTPAGAAGPLSPSLSPWIP